MIAMAAPSDAAAVVVSIQAGWFLSRKATTSPWPMPRSFNAPAHRRIRSYHCDQVQLRPR